MNAILYLSARRIDFDAKLKSCRRFKENKNNYEGWIKDGISPKLEGIAFFDQKDIQNRFGSTGDNIKTLPVKANGEIVKDDRGKIVYNDQVTYLKPKRGKKTVKVQCGVGIINNNVRRSSLLIYNDLCLGNNVTAVGHTTWCKIRSQMVVEINNMSRGPNNCDIENLEWLDNYIIKKKKYYPTTRLTKHMFDQADIMFKNTKYENTSTIVADGLTSFFEVGTIKWMKENDYDISQIAGLVRPL